jgi:hypothetical protein
MADPITWEERQFVTRMHYFPWRETSYDEAEQYILRMKAYGLQHPRVAYALYNIISDLERFQSFRKPPHPRDEWGRLIMSW